ncbi:hypothetical protein CEXT_331791 [Caerostris extrusa]|uniref:Uncharacterized protein n=1 Tax=Caerostris extrusa TaxID=172846 RepID=A0AAV4R574_CAEEX|nr:hypothetical protein CEXT_331791 [Caerostris extrusa]
MSSTKACSCGQEIIHSNFPRSSKRERGPSFPKMPLKRLANDDWVGHVIFDTFIQPSGDILGDTARKIWRWRDWSMNLPGGGLREDW